MGFVEVILTVIAKGFGVSANVLLSLIASGALVGFLNVVVGLFSNPALNGNELFYAFGGLFVACTKFIPEILEAANSFKGTAASTTGVGAAMRIW